MNTDHGQNLQGESRSHLNSRVLLIANIPAPYNIPLYNELARRNKLGFKILFLAETESNRSWQMLSDNFHFDYEFLEGWHRYIEKWELPIHLNRGVWGQIRAFDPDVIITSGYDTIAYWQAAIYCQFFGKRYVLWNGTTILSSNKTSGPVGWMKRVMISMANTYVAYGTRAMEYLNHLGAHTQDVSIATNTVDMEFFREAVTTERARDDFIKIRARYPEFLALYSGQLIKRKGIENLFKALSTLADSDIGLLIVGAGPLEMKLRDLSRSMGIENVYFEGFQKYVTLPRYYAIADICVLPSLEEVWGLVVNESLASGVFTLCSETAGAAPDMINQNWNGITFNPSNTHQLANALKDAKERITDIRDRREAISSAACREFSIKRAADGIVRAVNMAA